MAIKNFARSINTPMPGFTTFHSIDPANRNKAMDWMFRGDNDMEWIRPVKPGERMNENVDPNEQGHQMLLEAVMRMMRR